VKKICLALPTDRPCADTIAALCSEARYAAAYFDVEVHLLILDSTDEPTFAAHGRVLRAAPRAPRVVVHHLNEATQRDFLRRVIDRAAPAKPDLVLDLMHPADVSYGACTNRSFLYASALGCESVHRRGPGTRYQTIDGSPLFPIHHELASLGRRAIDAVYGVSNIALDPADAHRPVVIVGSSFIGELTVGIGEIYDLDRDAYHEIVSLWATENWQHEKTRKLVEESFRGAGTEPFRRDQSTLTVVDPTRIDMCNIGLRREVYERVPLPPAVNTIGSDDFLMHLIHEAGLPGVVHNRNLVNVNTPERRTELGFKAYHLRLAKSFLSMLYLNFIYERMAEAGAKLLDDDGHVRSDAVIELARQSAELDRAENDRRLDGLDRAYRRLGAKYAEVADLLAAQRPRLLDEAQADIEDFALLTEVWPSLVRASANTRTAAPTVHPAELQIPRPRQPSTNQEAGPTPGT
jgi:hypothetical protein